MMHSQEDTFRLFFFNRIRLQALRRRRARVASVAVAIAAGAQVDGSGTGAAFTVIKPPVIVGVGPVVPMGVALLVYSLFPSVI